MTFACQSVCLSVCRPLPDNLSSLSFLPQQPSFFFLHILVFPDPRERLRQRRMQVQSMMGRKVNLTILHPIIISHTQTHWLAIRARFSLLFEEFALLFPKGVFESEQLFASWSLDLLLILLAVHTMTPIFGCLGVSQPIADKRGIVCSSFRAMSHFNLLSLLSLLSQGKKKEININNNNKRQRQCSCSRKEETICSSLITPCLLLVVDVGRRHGTSALTLRSSWISPSAKQHLLSRTHSLSADFLLFSLLLVYNFLSTTSSLALHAYSLVRHSLSVVVRPASTPKTPAKIVIAGLTANRTIYRDSLFSTQKGKTKCTLNRLFVTPSWEPHQE